MNLLNSLLIISIIDPPLENKGQMKAIVVEAVSRYECMNHHKNKSRTVDLNNNDECTTLKVMLAALVLMMITIKCYLSNSYITTIFICLFVVPNKDHFIITAMVMFYIMLYARCSDNRFH